MSGARNAFGIPADGPEHWKLDGWRQSLEQAATLAQVIELECDLNRRIAWAARRALPMPFAPSLLRLVAQRWNQIAEQQGLSLRRKS
jgi:hypothetical protein